MTASQRDRSIHKYLTEHVRYTTGDAHAAALHDAIARFRKALILLPMQTTDLFLSGLINLTVRIESDPGLPLGMRTTCEGPSDARRYSIVLYEEHLHMTEDVFIGSFLRQLANVVAGQPPEEEWPTSRSERAGFKEMMEHQADALVWKWGLKEYSMRYIAATYPPHRVDLIMDEIERIVNEGPCQSGPH
jgi:hypothetical protein